MAEKETSAGKISAEKLCQMTGLTDRHHRRLAADGFFPPPINSEYQLLPTIQGLFKYYRERGQRANGALFDEKLAKETADRKMAEIELGKATKALIKADDVERAWTHCMMAIRARLLQMPDKFSLAWATWQSARDCKVGTEAEIRDAMQEIASNPDYTAGAIPLPADESQN